MKKLLIFLTLLSPLVLKSQNLVVELNNNNRLYFGIENELHVALGNYSQKRICVWVDDQYKNKVTIKGEAGHYKVTIEDTIPCVYLNIGILRSGKRILKEKRQFYVREIPLPDVRLGGLGAGSYLVSQVRANVSNGLDILRSCFDMQPQYYKLKNYRFTHIGQQRFTVYDIVKDSNNPLKKIYIREGDLIYIDKITFTIKGVEKIGEPMLIKVLNNGHNYYNIGHVRESSGLWADTTEISFSDLRLNAGFQNPQYLLKRINIRDTKEITHYKYILTDTQPVLLNKELWRENYEYRLEQNYPDGKLYFALKLERDRGSYRSFYRTGQPHLEGEIIDATCIDHGLLQKADSMGQVTLKGRGKLQYKFNLHTGIPYEILSPTGSWTGYYPDGQRQFKGYITYTMENFNYQVPDEYDPSILKDTTVSCIKLLRIGEWEFYKEKIIWSCIPLMDYPPDSRLLIYYNNKGEEISRTVR